MSAGLKGAARGSNGQRNLWRRSWFVQMCDLEAQDLRRISSDGSMNPAMPPMMVTIPQF
ncbi:MAG TPA: hypothetical protein VMD97_02965 [Candidatus Aquilonibacter sp.]|nr:hypothetical protein [Candidatus Aquilonibacter sp.]